MKHPLPSPPGTLSLSHNPLRQQHPPVLAAGPGAHPSLGRAAASPWLPVARQARTQLPPFPAPSEAAGGGGGTRLFARPVPPLSAMEGDKVRGRWEAVGAPGRRASMPAPPRPGSCGQRARGRPASRLSPAAGGP